MSMTREEAIKHIATWIYATSDLPPKQVAEALDLALAALRGPTREMVERTRGEWQSIHGLSEYYCSRCGEEFEIHAYDKEKYQFCPHCMAPMTDEAVEMMMERWKEAVENA